jgi:hypothetical protein
MLVSLLFSFTLGSNGAPDAFGEWTTTEVRRPNPIIGT